MKIWEARLNLICKDVDDYELNFYFEQLQEDYKTNSKCTEWVHSKGWIYRRVPMEVTISASYGNVSAVQGFDYELNQEELKEVEMSMRKLIREKLDSDREIYLRQYEEKLKVLKG